MCLDLLFTHFYYFDCLLDEKQFRGVLFFIYALVYFAARYRKVTICALTQSASGEKVVSLVP